MWVCHLCTARSGRPGAAGSWRAHYMEAHHDADLQRRRELRALNVHPFIDRAGLTSSGRGAFTAERQRMRDARG